MFLVQNEELTINKIVTGKKDLKKIMANILKENYDHLMRDGKDISSTITIVNQLYLLSKDLYSMHNIKAWCETHNIKIVDLSELQDALDILINYLNANGLSSKSCRKVMKRIEKEKEQCLQNQTYL